MDHCNMTSISGLLLTTECLIDDIPKEEKPELAHDHGGLGM